MIEMSYVDATSPPLSTRGLWRMAMMPAGYMFLLFMAVGDSRPHSLRKLADGRTLIRSLRTRLLLLSPRRKPIGV